MKINDLVTVNLRGTIYNAKIWSIEGKYVKVVNPDGLGPPYLTSRSKVTPGLTEGAPPVLGK